MIKKSLFGVVPPSFEYDAYRDDFKSVTIQTPDSIILLIEKEPDFPVSKGNIKTGDTVIKNQILKISDGAVNYTITPVSGEVTEISHYSGFYGREYHSLKITVKKDEAIDTAFSGFKENPDINNSVKYLKGIPGSPDFSILRRSNLETLVVNCADTDMGIFTNQYVALNDAAQIKSGIEYLKKISSNSGLKVILLMPQDLQKPKELADYNDVRAGKKYPSAFPVPVCEDLLGVKIPAGNKPEDHGVCFFNAETVAAVGKAYKNGEIPFEKAITVVDKECSVSIVKAEVGTPLRTIFSKLNIELKDGDRIISGGLMTGNTIYSEFQPVLCDMDGLIIQDSKDVNISSDTPCINCGDCIRVCPSKIQVSMLIRYIEALKYEDAQDNYDLDSCIECGICSYVCPAKIPTLQFIKLAKHELRLKMNEMEETDA